MVEAWAGASADKAQQQAILSIAIGDTTCPMTYIQLADKFKCPLKDIYKARKLACRYGAGVRLVKAKQKRQRMQVSAVRLLSQFSVDPQAVFRSAHLVDGKPQFKRLMSMKHLYNLFESKRNQHNASLHTLQELCSFVPKVSWGTFVAAMSGEGYSKM